MLVGNWQAYEASASPTLYARSVYRRPGEVVDIATVIRNYWSIPLMGFNSILEIPVYPFEVLSDQSSAAHDMIGKVEVYVLHAFFK